MERTTQSRIKKLCADAIVAKSIPKRVLYTLPEIIISIATVLSVGILLSVTPEYTGEQKQKAIKEIKEISLVLLIGSMVFLFLKTFASSIKLTSPVETGDVLIVAQAFPFFFSLMISGDDTEDLDKIINRLRYSIGISLFIQSILRLRSISCNVV